ncbi:hypothetical protein P7B02_15230 [Caulobacter segnis]|uniref:hypothetical protein n=1 Tax=Caulobacter segnis TaxID=88688 RepID=UPI00240FFF44|nr:hypothetical protein [Caulobacter segnis]MDG2522888.1 hypothetical protein [Caulobacter segnis]
MNLLYMDETYPDFTLPKSAWSVALTGMLVPAKRHREVRTQFYDAVATATKRTPSTVPPLAEIHAAALLPDCTDEERVAFLNRLVEIVLEFDLRIYRIGYARSRELLQILKTDRGIAGFVFAQLLHVLEPELLENQIWPVMETDRTNEQDQAFAGQIQYADHIESHLGAAILSRDGANLGEVLYSTKRSVHGAIVDCMAYLLNVSSLHGQGLPLSPFKALLRPVADRLGPAVRYNEIITMRFEAPPSDYRSSGASRYAVRLTPDTREVEEAHNLAQPRAASPSD